MSITNNTCKVTPEDSKISEPNGYSFGSAQTPYCAWCCSPHMALDWWISIHFVLFFQGPLGIIVIMIGSSVKHNKKMGFGFQRVCVLFKVTVIWSSFMRNNRDSFNSGYKQVNMPLSQHQEVQEDHWHLYCWRTCRATQKSDREMLLSFPPLLGPP